MVAILGGGDMPVVLRRSELARNRPQSNRLDGYEFIGECFIHDVMAGEVVRAVQQSESHEGSFDPVPVMEKLHDLSPLADTSQREYNNLKHEILVRARATYRELRVEIIDII